jgi:hypothetical protein
MEEGDFPSRDSEVSLIEREPGSKALCHTPPTPQGGTECLAESFPASSLVAGKLIP